MNDAEGASSNSTASASAAPVPSAGAPAIVVAVDCDGWATALPAAVAGAERAAFAALCRAGMEHRAVEVSILLSDDATLRDLNSRWRHKDVPTNVLAFEAGAPEVAGMPRPLGDVAIAMETAMREAAAAGIDFGDHVAHLVVHGVLHLLGHDHENDNDAEIMETLETEILAGLHIADPYASPGAEEPRDA